MDKVRVKTIRLDGTVIEVEGSPDEVARVLSDLDRKQMSPQPVPTVIVVPATQLNPLIPVVGPIWGQSPSILPIVPGWPITICEVVTTRC